MKESVTESISCDVLDWWKENSARFLLKAKAAKIVSCVRGDLRAPSKRAKHIGTADRMALLLDESFEMLVTAQYNIARHGGVEAIEVSMFSINF
jgi:hypothetical protein